MRMDVQGLRSLLLSGIVLTAPAFSWAVEVVPPAPPTASGIRLRTTETTAPATPAPPKKQVSLEPLAFNGVKIGVTTVADVAKAWGAPRQSNQQETIIQQTFVVEPFERLEATFYRGVILSATVVLREGLPLDDVAKRLEVSSFEAATLRDLNGTLVGRVYPERGVTLLYSAGADRKIAQIVLDALEAHPFVLRGEQYLNRKPSRALADADLAIQVDDQSEHAWRLRGEALLQLDQIEDALAAAQKATTFAGTHPASRLLESRCLARRGERTAATAKAQEALKLATDRPEWRARALCDLGDLLVLGTPQESQQALTTFQQAIQAAEPQLRNTIFETRRLAAEGMIAAHIGAANAVAHGAWQNKPLAVSRWLERAVQLSQDLYPEEPDRTVDWTFAIGVNATETAVHLNGQLDVRSWVDDCRTLAEQRLADVTDVGDRLAILRKLVLAYDNVAVSAQRRNDADAALKYAQQALAIWQQVVDQYGLTAADKELFGRLNFRLGSLHALLKSDHAQAVAWFDKARPNLELAVDKHISADPGALGETMVSMAVSYWTIGQQQLALDMTQSGLRWMERGVEIGSLDRGALAVPYGNLARMFQHTGDTQRAASYEELASKATGKTSK